MRAEDAAAQIHTVAMGCHFAGVEIDPRGIATATGHGLATVAAALASHGWHDGHPPYIPSRPTRGWMVFELRAWGRLPAGTGPETNDRSLVRILRELGYAIELGGAAKPKTIDR